MKLTIGKKIGITLATIVVFAGATAGTVFGVKKAKEKNSENSSSSVVVNPQPDNKTDDNKTDDNKQDDQKQDDNKQDDQKQDEDKKTEKDYMNECDSKLKTAIVNGLAQTGRLNAKINSYRVNQLTGKVYTNVSYEDTYGDKYTEFMTYETNLGDISSLTYEQVSKKMEGLQLTNRVASSVLQKAVSEELYNQLCDYVLDKVGLEGSQILNATKFKVNNKSMYETVLSVCKNDKIYQVSASVISDGSQEDHINKLMTEGRTKEIKITSEENFKEFVTESTAQASAQSNVVYFDVTFPTFDSETNKETTKTLTVRQTNGKADYRGFSL